MMGKLSNKVIHWAIAIVLLTLVVLTFAQWNQKQRKSGEEIFTPIYKMVLTDGVTDGVVVEIRSFTAQVDNSKNMLWLTSELILYDPEGQDRVSSLTKEELRGAVPVEQLHYDDCGATMGTSFVRSNGEYICNFVTGWPLDELDHSLMIMPQTISGVISGISFILSVPPLDQYIAKNGNNV